MFKNSRGDVIARYYINEKIFGLIKIVKIEEEGKPDEILLSGSYFTNNMEQPGTISYNEFLRSDAIIVVTKNNEKGFNPQSIVAGDYFLCHNVILSLKCCHCRKRLIFPQNEAFEGKMSSLPSKRKDRK